MKLHTVFLRDGCVLPDRIDLRKEPFCEDWAAVVGVFVSDLDARIRKAGWHFLWVTDSHSSRGLGSTAETAVRRALVRALREVKNRFNAAELGSVKITNCLGLQIAKITVDTRHVQKHTSLESAEEIRLKQVLAV